jgi:DNA polymerase-3 subunit delta
MAKSADNAMHALELLTDPAAVKPTEINVVAGDEAYLRREASRTLAQRFVTGDDGAADADVEEIDGRTAELRDVVDALSEVSLFGDGRVVIVRDADPLIKRFREKLEAYVARPVKGAALLLDVQSWASNTRLAKSVGDVGLTIRCTAPQQGREVGQFHRQLKTWLIAVAKREFDARLTPPAVDALLELLPSQPGLLYQEVVKLSLLSVDGEIDPALVRKYVGGWRTQKTWDMIDAAADGRAVAAIEQLDRLLAAGEEPYALLAQMSSTLRRFAAAVVLIEQAEQQGRRASLRTALELAGTPRFKLGDAERQLRQIGRDRAHRLYDWLLAADLGLKGHNSSKQRARHVLETLIIRLAPAVTPLEATGR